jgi:AcrR family transcriptional regulator
MAQDFVARFPMTRRALAKQQTRRLLIAAARRLVSERGYEAATLRDVAALAQVSTGAVFANFQDKADLFNAVIADDLAELLFQMKQAGADAESASEALLAMLTAGYAVHFESLSLVQAQLGFAWCGGRPLDQRHAGPAQRVMDVLAEVLRRGVDAGELSTAMDVELIAEMAWDGYVAGYRHAIFDGWTLEALCMHMRRRINVLVDGYRLNASWDEPHRSGLSAWSAEPDSAPWSSRRDVARPAARRG